MTFTIAILVTLIGTALAARGIRGRRFADDAPRCRRCGYDLRATTGDRCPECGTVLTGRWAIRRGRVWRWPGWIVVGVLLVTIGGTTIGLDRGGWLEKNRLLNIAPSSFHLWIARHGTVAMQADSIDRLLSRYQFASVYPPERQLTPGQVADFVDLLIQAQAEPRSLWARRWNYPIDHAVVAGRLSPERQREYIDQCFDSCVTVVLTASTLQDDDLIDLAFDLRPGRVTDGGHVSFGPTTDMQRGRGWCAAPIAATLSVDGERLERSAGRDVGGFMLPSQFESINLARRSTFVFRDRLPVNASAHFGVGRHTLRVDLAFDVYDASDRSRIVARSTRRYEFPIQILARPRTTMATTLPFHGDVR